MAGLSHARSVPLSVGGEYYSELRVTNHLGQQSTARTDGFTVVPTAAGAWAAGLLAPRYAPSHQWPLSWAALVPASPGPHDFRVAMGTGVAVDNLLPWHALGPATAWTWDGAGAAAAMLDGGAYFVTVLTRAGVRSVARVVLDTTAPVLARPALTASTPDGARTSRAYIMGPTVDLCWRGTFSDPHTGIASYAVTVTADAAAVAAFHDVAAECVPLTHGLPSGAVVDVAITAVNPAGLRTTASAALTVDFSPPAPPAAFHYGTASAPVAAQASRAAFGAEWAPFHDPESAPVATEVCLGTAPGRCDLREDRVGNATALRYAVLPSFSGTEVWLGLRACNSAGLCLSWAPAAPLIIDTVPPAVTVSSAGPTQCVAPDFGCDTVWLTDPTSVEAALEVRDPAAGLDACAWGIGAAPGGDAHMPFRVAVQGSRQAALATRLTAAGLALPEGVPLFVTVQCWDRAGLRAARALPIAVLGDAPGAGQAAVRVSPEVTRSAGRVTVTWSGFSALRPALVQYAVAVGSARDLQDIAPWAAAHGHSHVVDVDGFPEGPLWVQVRGRYPTGQAGVAWGRLVVDDTAPAPGTLRHIRAGNVSHGTNVSCVPNASCVDLQWSGFADALSGVAGYAWAVVPPGGGGAPDWQPRGRRAYVSLPEAERQPGDYEVRVRATDAASNAAQSTLVLRVDGSAPEVGPVSVYGAAGGATLASTHELWVQWGTAVDAECGIADYLVAIGGSEDSTAALPYTSVGSASPVRLGGLALRHGRCYVLTLVAVNGAGLGGRAYAAFCVDATPPEPGRVYVQSPAASGACQAPDAAPVAEVAAPAQVTVCAAGLTDPESDTTWDLSVVVGEGAQALEVAAAAAVPQALLAPGGPGHTVDLTPLGTAFTAGAAYRVRLRSTNAAGLTRLAASPAFHWDASPPALAWVLFGTGPASVKCVLPGAELRAQWALMDPESGVDEVAWAVGSAAGAQDLMPYTPIGHEEGYVLSARAAVPLVAGHHYFVSIRATNKAGLGALYPVEVPLSVVACTHGPDCLTAVRCL